MVLPNSPAVTPDPNAGPVEPKGGTDDKPVTLEAVNSAIQQQFESIGLNLKNGQRIDQMIHGAAKRATLESLGVPKDSNVTEHLQGLYEAAGEKLIAKFAAAKVNGDPDPNAGKGEGQNDLTTMRTDFDQMRTGLNKLTQENDDLKVQAAEEKRQGLVRDALALHKIRPEFVSNVTRGMVEGWGGVKPTVNPDDGKLYVPDENGMPIPFENHLQTYFQENKGWLESTATTGVGVGRGAGSPPAGAPREIDFSSQGTKAAVADWQKDPDAMAKDVEAQVAEKAKGIW